MQKKQKHSRETIEKLKKRALERDNSKRIESLPRGKNHWRFTKTPSILTLHRRLHRSHGPAKRHECERKCGRMALDWALIAKKHTGERKDYIPLCRKCHIALDNHPSKVDRSKHQIIRDSKGRIKTTIIKK